MLGKGKISFGKISLPAPPKPEEIKDEVSESKPSSGFGSFGNQGKNQEDISEQTDVSSSMGFSSFGKSAKVFNLDKMIEESKKIAVERNEKNLTVMKTEEEEEKVEEAEEESDDDDFVGPPLPPSMVQKTDSDDDSDSDDDTFKFPISHELELKHGSKCVSSIAIDPSGSRLVSGSIDYDVKYWDFQGMDVAKESFRSFRPSDGYPINSVEYSCSGDKVLVVSGSAQAKVYDRDGVEVYECVRGDMYLQDMAKTKGHISALTDGKWHPKNKEEFLTSARDGTCRIWNTTKTFQQCHVLKPRATGGLKALPSTCNYSRDGLLVGCACEDGSVQMWDHRKTFVNTCLNFRNAHQKGDVISSFDFSFDNKSFATRGEDTLKLWDLRNNKACVFEKKGLFSRFSSTNCLFSPNDKMVITGTSMDRGESSGKLKFFDRATFEVVRELDIGASHVVQTIWHPRLNQIMIGCGDGLIRILYDKKDSRHGAVFVSEKKKRRPKPAEEVVDCRQIITPHALPLFRDERHRPSVKIQNSDRKDPLKSKQPELPLGKAGTGGRVAAGGSTLSSYIIRNLGLRNKAKEEENPREALLRHAKEASDNPYWISPAYTNTQPETIFQTSDDEEEQPNKKMKK